jgi:uncharacterized cofD-like protein
MTGIDLLAEPLLEELEPGESGCRVVALGGGHGLAQALLAVQAYAGEITAVVSVADDGGSSGRLAPALGLPPPGDCRRALLALSPDPSPWRDAVCHRFAAGDVAGHALGNLILAGLAARGDGLEGALATLGLLLGARGRVIPAAPVPLTLRAVIDGEEVRGQVAVAQARGRLSELQVLPPEAAASPSAIEALADADQVIIGPGSLFTSLAATLVVPGMTEAVNAGPGRLIYICNLATQDGETLGMDGADHVAALCRVTGLRLPDVVVANDAPFVVPPTIEAVVADPGQIEGLGTQVETASLADPSAAWPQHDPARLGAVLRRLA